MKQVFSLLDPDCDFSDYGYEALCYPACLALWLKSGASSIPPQPRHRSHRTRQCNHPQPTSLITSRGTRRPDTPRLRLRRGTEPVEETGMTSCLTLQQCCFSCSSRKKTATTLCLMASLM